MGYAVDYANGYAMAILMAMLRNCISYFIGYPSLFNICDASKLYSIIIHLYFTLLNWVYND